jgi:hypothetical protein
MPRAYPVVHSKFVNLTVPVFAANAWVGPSESDGVVLGARILLNEAREFIPGSEKWITWADVNRLHDRISGREAKTH